MEEKLKQAELQYKQVVEAISKLTVQKLQLEGYIQAVRDLMPRPGNVVDFPNETPVEPVEEENNVKS